MNRQSVILVILMALFAASPVIAALDAAAASTAATMPADCPDAMDASPECPCCPDGLPLQGSCAFSCAAAIGLPPAAIFIRSQPAVGSSCDLILRPLLSQIYTPVNPPPIR